MTVSGVHSAGRASRPDFGNLKPAELEGRLLAVEAVTTETRNEVRELRTELAELRDALTAPGRDGRAAARSEIQGLHGARAVGAVLAAIAFTALQIWQSLHTIP